MKKGYHRINSFHYAGAGALITVSKRIDPNLPHYSGMASRLVFQEQ